MWYTDTEKPQLCTQLNLNRNIYKDYARNQASPESEQGGRRQAELTVSICCAMQTHRCIPLDRRGRLLRKYRRKQEKGDTTQRFPLVLDELV